MTRLYYWLHAQTQYNIHSPFLFEMYRDVLFARLDDATRRQHNLPRGDRFHEIIYKCCDHYHLAVSHQPQTVNHPLSAQLSAPPHPGLDSDSRLSILVIDHPHATPVTEQHWEQLKSDPNYQVSVDLYDVALLIHNPHLHPQHFLLR